MGNELVSGYLARCELAVTHPMRYILHYQEQEAEIFQSRFYETENEVDEQIQKFLDCGHIQIIDHSKDPFIFDLAVKKVFKSVASKVAYCKL